MFRPMLSRLQQPHVFFLLISIPLVTILVFLIPPFNVADENAHFFRSYGISLGDLKAKVVGVQCGSEIPASVVASSSQMADGIAFNPAGKLSRDRILEEMNRPLNPDVLTFANYPNTAPYSPIPYIPQIIGIFIGRVFEASPLVTLYLARTLNAGLGLFLLAHAIRRLPSMAWALAAAHMTPMAIFQISSASADVLTLGLTAIVLCAGFRLISGVDRLTSDGKALALGMLAACMTLSKFAYFPIILIYLLVPRENIGETPMTYCRRMILLGIPSIVLQGLWVLYIKDAVVPTRQDIVVNTMEQVRFVIGHPLHFLKAIWVSFAATFRFYLESYYGILGWLDTTVPASALRIVAAGFVLACLRSERALSVLNIQKRIGLMAILLSLIISIFFFLYLYWNPVGANQVEGIQGRYFIPLSIILAFIISIPKTNRLLEKNIFATCMYAIFSYSGYVTILTVYARYYVK